MYVPFRWDYRPGTEPEHGEIIGGRQKIFFQNKVANALVLAYRSYLLGHSDKTAPKVPF